MDDEVPNVYYIRLVTGKEVIGVVTSASFEQITMHKPMSISMSEKKGFGFFQLAQYSYAVDDVVFNRKFIVEHGDATEQVKLLYKRYYDEEDRELSTEEELMEEFLRSEVADGYEGEGEMLYSDDMDEIDQRVLSARNKKLH